jgi:YVTN family beta-propeller protein
MSVKHHSRARAVLLVPALCLIFGAAQAPAAPDGAQLVVYVEVPRNAVDQTLGIAAVALHAGSSVEPLRPLVTELVAGRLAGRQVRLVDEVVPPGVYEALEIRVDRVEAPIGGVIVRPEPPADPLQVPLNRPLREGECVLVTVRWVPEAVDPDAPGHLPRLELVAPEVGPLGSLAFVTNEGSGNVSVVHLASRRVVDVVRTGDGPRGAAYSRLRQRLYVTNAESHSVVALDVPSRQRIRAALTSVGDEPSRIAISADESRLYVLHRGSDVLSVLDAESLQEISRTFLGEAPRDLAVDPASGLVYIASELATGVRVFDPARPDREISLPADVAPSEVVFDPVSRHLHVAGADQRVLTVVSVDTQSVVARLNVCSAATGLALHPRSRRLYAALGGCRELAVLSPEVGLEVDSVRLDAPPGLIAFDADYRELLVTSPTTAELRFYNANTLQPVGVAAVGEQPFQAIVPR